MVFTHTCVSFSFLALSIDLANVDACVCLGSCALYVKKVEH